MMKTMVTGANGRLGGRLAELLRVQGQAVAASDVDTLDITDFAAVRNYVRAEKPDLVLHPAAWTDVDGCALDPDRALRINALGAQNVAVAAYDVGAPIVYISSNEVFNGASGSPYREYDTPDPVNPYGVSKLAGERAVAAVNPRHYIVRTAWLFAHGGRNFLHAIINAATAGKALRVVSDEVANPTYNDDLADALLALTATGRFGTYHLTNAGACSRYAFARYTLDRAGLGHVPIEAITRHQWPRPSTPPQYCALTNLAGESLGIRLRPWQQAVDAFLAREGLLAG
jgi:dTDP-4-dehydrorhamnose reductase